MARQSFAVALSIVIIVVPSSPVVTVHVHTCTHVCACTCMLYTLYMYMYMYTVIPDIIALLNINDFTQKHFITSFYHNEKLTLTKLPLRSRFSNFTTCYSTSSTAIFASFDVPSSDVDVVEVVSATWQA